MERISGYVDHIIYRNEDNGYTVMIMNSDGEEITCVGSLQYINEGELIEAEGTYTEHNTYGTQFKISSFELKTPEDELSMERYLGSGAIKGIGLALAARIVRKFKSDTFRIMEEEPERLSEVRGISEKKAREIAQQMEEKKDLRKAMVFLQQYGISMGLCVKIYNQYGAEIYRVVQENPYRMADEVRGIGFKIADEIAEKAGIHTDSDFRIRSGMFYCLTQSMQEGHVYLPIQILYQRASELLGVSMEAMERNLNDLIMDRKVKLKGDRIYSLSNYNTELHIAKMLHDLNVSAHVPEQEIDRKIHEVELETDTELEEQQKYAVARSVNQGFLVITGGPGTGKTTTINALIHYFEKEGMSILLAAPTGRAAKRMTEATGYEAQTIHRLLELSGNPDDDGPSRFERNMENPLNCDVLIIDEVSMVDMYLMHALLSAVTVGTRLILVGDVNQLPSVGPGSVLKDIIDSECFPVVKLNKIFRQASESDIVVNAHKINSGQHFVLDNKSRDFFFLKREDANVIIRVMLTLIQQKLPGYVHAKPMDIQVLTPMRKGMVGVERLNGILQQYLNPPATNKNEKEVAGGVFRVGDKVMQIHNNYQMEWEIRGRYGIPIEKGMGIFNGDMGIIHEINTFAEQLTVVFDDNRFVDYSFKELDDLELAYAITIHKSQGSEYPAVVIPVMSGPRMLMSRNLLYTAITRARTCVTLVGSEEVFNQMIDNESEQKRYTSLREQICDWNEEL